jgi:Flp pilus assembly protein TadG
MTRNVGAMSGSAHIKRMLTSRSGNVGIIFALAMPLVIGSAALSVETSYWYYKQHQLQAAADNAAFAAGLDARNGQTVAVLDATALNVATQNTYDNSLGTIVVENPPSSGPYAGNTAAVTVTLTQREQRFFTQLFSSAPVIVKATATSVFQTTSDACILALDPGASGAATFTGNSSLTLNGCVVMSNSIASDSVYVWGAANLTTNCVMSAGGYADHGGLTETACNAPTTNAPAAPDPYKNLPAPAVDTSHCANGNGANLNPGTYCGGLTLKGNTNLKPGVYVINGGVLDFNANANITGSGVTFFLTNGATVTMNGNAAVNISAPTSGTYAGILFYGDRNSPGLTEKFNGTAGSQMTGAIYFPTDNVTYLGNFSGANGCTYIVADTVSYSGNTNFNVNCTNYGMAPIPAGAAVKLVG